MNEKKEEVRRLTPKTTTLRELYLLSGNCCAFPGCNNPIVNQEGLYVGEVCHIEAAMPGGERFNPNMTNEERRDIKNLVLLCHEHHITTDNVELFPVSRMREIKRNHENLYRDTLSKMKTSIKDYSNSTTMKKALNGVKINSILSWGLDENELLKNVEILNEIIDKLKTVPLQTRKLFGIMVMRAKKGLGIDTLIIPVDEVINATDIDKKTCSIHIDSLKRNGLVSDMEMNNENGCTECFLYGNPEWNYWKDIRSFCQKTGIDITKICYELDLSVFDE